MEADVFKCAIIDAIDNGIIKSSSDCYRITNGGYLYDRGVEHILQANVAYEIERKISMYDGYCVEIKHRTSDIINSNNIPFPFRSGRIGLYASVGDKFPHCLVEFKRYLNPAVVRRDIERLATIVQHFDGDRPTLRIICGAMYQTVGYTNDFSESYPNLIRRIREEFQNVSMNSYVGKDYVIKDRLGRAVSKKFDRHLSIITCIEKR